MRQLVWLLALLPAAATHAATVQADVSQTAPAEINLPVAVDDAHLTDPPGYFAPAAPANRVVRRITIENTGSQLIRNPDVRVNGHPLLPIDPLVSLGVEKAHDPASFFPAWRDRVIHATTGLDAARDPTALLNVFGAAYCGEDTRALAALAVALGGEARFARLEGHSVTELRLKGGRWTLLDGDQNLLYLDWDNRTPVGEAEILADPLLALRTQVFGRQSHWRLDAAWQNASRFEFVDHSREPKLFRLKNAPPPRNWVLAPGEKIVIDLSRTPDRVLAASPGLRTNAALRAVVCVVEFHTRRGAGETVSLPWPRLGDEQGEPAYETKAGDSPIELQAARAQFPFFLSGTNTIHSQSPGNLRIGIDYEPPALTPTKAPVVRADPPRISVGAKDADRVWWQISADADFRLVPPNLDRTANYAPEFTLSAIDETFLSPGPLFLRAKVKRAGVWSDWSAPATFEVKKPPQPKVIGMEGADGDQMFIRWAPTAGTMLVFGSNRIDFLPEIYGDLEVVRLENGSIRESRPNKNLLATVPAEKGEVYVPIRASYRLIAQEEGSLSVPSAPAHPSRMPAQVLQNRHEKPEGELTGRDVATEMDVP